VTGVGERRGQPCRAFTEHSYLGMEAKTIKAILSWIPTGAAPAGVSESKSFSPGRRNVLQV